MAAVTRPDGPTHVVGICGGAVAGSEVAALCARRGAIAIVFEQGDRPYGKIEDGLPRWHEKLRLKEYERIDANLATPGVLFLPRTRCGEDVSLATLREELGLSAVILATGAWRDRPLAVPDAEAHVGKGLVYQNSFVYWFNHYPEEGYSGPVYQVESGAAVIGGGLASIDVVKIIQFELYGRALRALGHEVTMLDLELRGIPETCQKLGVDPDSLGIEDVTLYYRRGMEDMPLASAEDPDPEKLAKLRAARVKIMERVMRKYRVRFEGFSTPTEVLVEEGRMVGLRFTRTAIAEGRVQPVPGSEFEVRTPLVVSSIGSIPVPLEGVPTRGELYHYKDWSTGEVEGLPGVFGLGNVLTGKGNIRDSRENAKLISTQILEAYLGFDEWDAEAHADRLHGSVASRVVPTVDRALEQKRVPAEQAGRILDWVQSRWIEVGCSGDYAEWIDAHRPPPLEGPS